MPIKSSIKGSTLSILRKKTFRPEQSECVKVTEERDPTFSPPQVGEIVCVDVCRVGVGMVVEVVVEVGWVGGWGNKQGILRTNRLTLFSRRAEGRQAGWGMELGGDYSV